MKDPHIHYSCEEGGIDPVQVVVLTHIFTSVVQLLEYYKDKYDRIDFQCNLKHFPGAKLTGADSFNFKLKRKTIKKLGEHTLPYLMHDWHGEFKQPTDRTTFDKILTLHAYVSYTQSELDTARLMEQAAQDFLESNCHDHSDGF